MSKSTRSAKPNKEISIKSFFNNNIENKNENKTEENSNINTNQIIEIDSISDQSKDIPIIPIILTSNIIDKNLDSKQKGKNNISNKKNRIDNQEESNPEVSSNVDNEIDETKKSNKRSKTKSVVTEIANKDSNIEASLMLKSDDKATKNKRSKNSKNIDSESNNKSKCSNCESNNSNKIVPSKLLMPIYAAFRPSIFDNVDLTFSNDEIPYIHPILDILDNFNRIPPMEGLFATTYCDDCYNTTLNRLTLTFIISCVMSYEKLEISNVAGLFDSKRPTFANWCLVFNIQFYFFKSEPFRPIN